MRNKNNLKFIFIMQLLCSSVSGMEQQEVRNFSRVDQLSLSGLPKSQIPSTERSLDELVAPFLENLYLYEKKIVTKIFSKIDKTRREDFAKLVAQMLDTTEDRIMGQVMIEPFPNINVSQSEHFTKLVTSMLDDITSKADRIRIIYAFYNLEVSRREGLARHVASMSNGNTKEVNRATIVEAFSALDESKWEDFAILVTPVLNGTAEELKHWDILKLFPTVEESQREDFAKLISPVLDAITDKRSYFTIIHSFFNVEATQRKDFAKLVSLMLIKSFSRTIPKIIKAFSTVNESQREIFTNLIVPILNKIPYTYYSDKIIKVFTKIDASQRGNFAKLVDQLLKYEQIYTWDIVKILSEVDVSKREDFVKLVTPMLDSCDEINCTYYGTLSIIQALSKVHPLQQEDFAKLITPMLEGIIDGDDRSVIVRAFASVDASQREDFAKFVLPMLEGIIQQERCLIIKAFAPFASEIKTHPLPEILSKMVERAFVDKNPVLAKLLFNRLIRINPLIADGALLYAVTVQNQELINMLIPVTTQNGIRAAYRQVQELNREAGNNPISQSIYQQLYNLVPHNLRVEGDAYAIHNYSNTEVKVISKTDALDEAMSGSETDISSQSNPLVGVVFNTMVKRLEQAKDVDLLPYEVVTVMINEGIERCFSPQKRGEARQAAFFKLESDTAYEAILQIVVSFLNHFHPKSLDQWIEGFVGESIEAYRGSWDNTSCTKGIKERTLTGLRGIDTDLDTLFGQAEGPKAMKIYIQSWNPNQNASWIAQQLLDNGLTKDASPIQAAEIFRLAFKKQADSLAVDIADFNADVEILYDYIIDYYDLIRVAAFPHLNKVLNQ